MTEKALGKSLSGYVRMIAGCDAGAFYPAYGEPGRINS
ncbi:hypothetical protein AA98_4053 [Escherichia coli 2-011-08_S1_C1]|nr:hypothetical protein AA98_4053 [Escherichia coli 2-011-08_S1_C1]